MMGDSHCFDGTVSAAEFHIAASSFVERWNNRECLALPPWLWVSPLKQPWVHDQVERYLALEKLRLPWSCKEDDSTCCIASERSICAAATDDGDGDGDYLIVDDATLVESSDLETHHYYDFHIVYSFSYRVPLLYFRVYGADGQPLALSEFERDLPVGSADELLKSKWTFITQEEHPFLNRPWYKLHPCGTSEWLRLLIHTDHSVQSREAAIEIYLLSWFSFVGQIFGLNMLPVASSYLGNTKLKSSYSLAHQFYYYKRMDPSKAPSIFQMTVYKMPPDMNRTALSPPQRGEDQWSARPDLQVQRADQGREHPVPRPERAPGCLDRHR
ncbi:hypothetical protein SAY87_031688 [Trapa incisa]|uniref:Ubiquitin-like-conjugating enzyme ATG10 n=1 Tax=Trapa incisa TaxID=236973 RepID=A0AAN7KXP0_9MYRT|nr:hypothetical protein SAY87_031688 [Trapa incisa]